MGIYSAERYAVITETSQNEIICFLLRNFFSFSCYSTTTTMCPGHATESSTPTQSEMVAVPINEKRGTSRSADVSARLAQQRRNPYGPNAADFLSNISNFNIIESTLRGKYHSELAAAVPLRRF